MHELVEENFFGLLGDLLVPFKEVCNFRDGHAVECGLSRKRTLLMEIG
jgi:hypothetical protein